ncbi:MAG: twin-arginine translocation pathway signal protein [Pseudopedobacter saltans]|uniref:Twin-arginine translocation pathway signal protein n=1 Tax=Pseudopedobacter saltans TaxID=151895 RepID=A0A2W5EXI3_9SPHI|nr:MAG: twin-arginine translocation pathway signal protein [Pseudopedobacter saltans]
MDRRSVLKSVALLVGGSVVGGELFLAGCKEKTPTSSTVEDLFKPEQTTYMDEIAETILPKTSTPGAKDAKVGAFMAVMVRDCYTPEDQKIFIDGLKKINDLSESQFKKTFLETTPEQKTQLLIQLDNEQKEYNKKRSEAKKVAAAKDTTANHNGNRDISMPNHYFALMKQLTLLGYFTSEPGATKALRYLPVPGKYDGNYPYKKGDKAWALS